MNLLDDSLDKILLKALYCRAVEESIYDKIQKKIIKIPVYLSAGQELISSTISHILEQRGITDRQIFIQHRGHSTYLNFGGNIETLFKELLGLEGYGKRGSASIDCKISNIFGHDGMMGSHIPISVGMCYSSKKPTIVFTGDAAAEEDYALAAYGWAATKKLPILFIVEDNNLSILTEKKVRRSWELHDVCNGFGLESYNIDDDPQQIYKFKEKIFNNPILLNINTKRKFWHAGAGIDNPEQKDRLFDFIKSNENLKAEYNNIKESIEIIWKKLLEKQ
jgi:acetoin:2,6-dichlorophenolindophenol oxidoreductase subunit alpha